MQVRELLKYPYLKRFYAARFISNFGNGMSPVAIAFGILHLKNGSPTILGLVLGSATVAMLIVAPFGGVIADKFGRVRMAGIADTWGSIGLFLQAIFFIRGDVPLWVMLVANINFGFMWGIFWPSSVGITPALVPEEKLQQTNAFGNFFTNSSMILGAAAAGILVSQFGAGWALFIDAATFLISGILILSFANKVHSKAESEESMLGDLIHGWKVFISYRWIVVEVAGFSIIVMAWAAGETVLGPLIALKHFDGPKSWSLVLTLEAIGLVIGSLVGMRVKFKYPMRALTFLTLFFAVYMYTLAAPQPIWVIAFAAFCWGIVLDLWSSIWPTALQRTVPRETLSRISSFDSVGSLLFRPLGLAIAGPVSSWIGIPRTMELAAGITVTMVIVMLLVPEVWKMEMPSQETLN
jgi:MFS family permease